jgi:hypothetical protein
MQWQGPPSNKDGHASTVSSQPLASLRQALMAVSDQTYPQCRMQGDTLVDLEAEMDRKVWGFWPET